MRLRSGEGMWGLQIAWVTPDRSTGSHNPPDMHGFKILLGKKTLSGAQIQDLKARCEKVLPCILGRYRI